MKKAGIISILISINAVAGNHIDEASVPQSVVEKFHQQFGQIQELAWYQQDNTFKAIVQQQGHEIEASYNTKAQCIEVHRRIAAEALPAEIQQSIKKSFPEGYHIASVYVVDKQNVNPVFKVRIRQGRLTYDMEFEDNNGADIALHKNLIK